MDFEGGKKQWQQKLLKDAEDVQTARIVIRKQS